MDDMATQVLPDVETRPEGTDTTGNDEPKMFHYVKKNKIAESAVLGNMVVALCGETFPVTRGPSPDPRSARTARRSSTSCALAGTTERARIRVEQGVSVDVAAR